MLTSDLRRRRMPKLRRDLIDAQSWLREDRCGTESAACYSRPCHRRRTVNRGLPAGLVVAQPVDLGRLPRGPAHILTP